MNAPPLYITDQATLAGFCAGLRDVDMLALDTEFIRESSYYPRLCLIQIAGAGQIACLDPLALPSLAPLLALLYNPGILQALHAAHQDMEVLFQSGGAVPAPIFDTQLAALVLGEGSQIGYADLVARRPERPTADACACLQSVAAATIRAQPDQAAPVHRALRGRFPQCSEAVLRAAQRTLGALSVAGIASAAVGNAPRERMQETQPAALNSLACPVPALCISIEPGPADVASTTHRLY